MLTPFYRQPLQFLPENLQNFSPKYVRMGDSHYLSLSTLLVKIVKKCAYLTVADFQHFIMK